MARTILLALIAVPFGQGLWSCAADSGFASESTATGKSEDIVDLAALDPGEPAGDLGAADLDPTLNNLSALSIGDRWSLKLATHQEIADLCLRSEGDLPARAPGYLEGAEKASGSLPVAWVQETGTCIVFMPDPHTDSEFSLVIVAARGSDPKRFDRPWERFLSKSTNDWADVLVRSLYFSAAELFDGNRRLDLPAMWTDTPAMWIATPTCDQVEVMRRTEDRFRELLRSTVSACPGTPRCRMSSMLIIALHLAEAAGKSAEEQLGRDCP